MSDLADAKKEYLINLEENDERDLKFENIENKLSKSRLTHALLLFERILKDDMPKSAIGGAEHDIIFLLDAESEEIFFERVTNEELMEIFSCGVSYHEHYDSLCAFV
mgnify:CR=1 FL=1